MRQIVLVDIDHTISNAFWRDPMIGTLSWDEYHLASVDDHPIEDTVRILNALVDNGKFELVGITARPAKWRQLSMKWCTRHNIPLSHILMREDEDYRPSPVIKLALAKAYIESEKGNLLKDHIAFVMDDRDDVAAAFKGEGVTVLQTHCRRD